MYSMHQLLTKYCEYTMSSISNPETTPCIHFNLKLHAVHNEHCKEFLAYIIKSNHIEEFTQQYHEKKIRKKYMINTHNAVTATYELVFSYLKRKELKMLYKDLFNIIEDYIGKVGSANFILKTSRTNMMFVFHSDQNYNFKTNGSTKMIRNGIRRPDLEYDTDLENEEDWNDDWNIDEDKENNLEVHTDKQDIAIDGMDLDYE